MNFRKYIPGTFENIKSQKAKILSNYLNKKRASGIYISMTTFAPRLEIFEYTVLSLLRGSLLPEKILIYVPQGFRILVLENEKSFIRSELDKGFVEIIEMDVDMRCHSKYYYSFQEYGERKDIVICDDDMVYYRDWLKDLVRAAQRHTNYDVLAFKAVDVQCQLDRILPYNEWIHCSSLHKGVGKALYAEGVGGVYYRKGCFTEKKTFDPAIFLELAPNADDVWLWFWTHYNNLQVKYVMTSRYRKLQYIIPSSQENALWIENTINRRNDIYVDNCHQYFRDKLSFNITKKINNR